MRPVIEITGEDHGLAMAHRCGEQHGKRLMPTQRMETLDGHVARHHDIYGPRDAVFCVASAELENFLEAVRAH